MKPRLPALSWSRIVAAKAVAFREALSPDFKEYQGQVVKNARALRDVLQRAVRGAG